VAWFNTDHTVAGGFLSFRNTTHSLPAAGRDAELVIREKVFNMK